MQSAPCEDDARIPMQPTRQEQRAGKRERERERKGERRRESVSEREKKRDIEGVGER